MKSRIATAFTLCLLVAPWVNAEQTLDEVVAGHLEARGGLEALRQVESALMTGTMTMGPGQAPFEWLWQRPDRLRVEFELRGMHGIQAFDGEQGWQVMPFMGSPDAELIDEEQQRQLAAQADFDGPFIDTEAKGYTLEYLGEEGTEGARAHRIKITNKYGDETLVFLDSETLLQIRSEGRRRIRGQEIEFETVQGDFKPVDGLVLAHTIESRQQGKPAGRVLVFDAIELNVEVDETVFAMPEAGGEPQAADTAADTATGNEEEPDGGR